jgi:hypothetical protein
MILSPRRKFTARQASKCLNLRSRSHRNRATSSSNPEPHHHIPHFTVKDRLFLSIPGARTGSFVHTKLFRVLQPQYLADWTTFYFADITLMNQGTLLLYSPLSETCSLDTFDSGYFGLFRFCLHSVTKFLKIAVQSLHHVRSFRQIITSDQY